jgi:ATP-dependent Zn protease
VPDPVKIMRTAIHEAGHVVVAVALRGSDWVHGVDIRRDGGDTSLGLRDWPNELLPAAELRDSIIVGYGGLAAEELVFGSASLSATSDIEQATTLACLLARVGQLEGAGAIDYALIGAFTGIAAPDAAVSIIASILAGARMKAIDIVCEYHVEIHRLSEILAFSDGVVSGVALRSALERVGLLDNDDDRDLVA